MKVRGTNMDKGEFVLTFIYWIAIAFFCFWFVGALMNGKIIPFI